jgi:hypothetical protein
VSAAFTGIGAGSPRRRRSRSDASTPSGPFGVQARSSLTQLPFAAGLDQMAPVAFPGRRVPVHSAGNPRRRKGLPCPTRVPVAFGCVQSGLVDFSARRAPENSGSGGPYDAGMLPASGVGVTPVRCCVLPQGSTTDPADNRLGSAALPADLLAAPTSAPPATANSVPEVSA